MRFLSLCSGIDAASVAFGPLGWDWCDRAEKELDRLRKLKATGVKP